MKKLFFAVFLSFSAAAVFAQATVTEQFQKITTMEQAQKFIDANAPLKPVIFNVVAGKDTTMIAKRLLRQTKGNVFNVGYTTYKVLESNESVKYRASYIFLDGGSLTPAEIDSMKKIITKKVDAGQSFDALSDQYTMDGNTTHGDTGWFFGEEMMPKEFQDAVSKHKTGEVFYVDVPDKQWHYIVKKTYDDDLKKEMTILRANGR
ncbi:peptidylprolyl isomerase [Pinibacter soli]|uniref:Peptidylprolyl isomerase n=1 Tax=Pinibacter soli TaxID=3044211 RepID=A0ABT6RH29_9BACT|nr:peptidylprolyl isomerase [Pinibacter soli]MDI3321726.1 peptidylprolyl isomerase [Pinibacter soli]